MNDKNHTPTVTIVVPIYRQALTEYEEISFRQLFKVLGHYDVAVIKPHSLALDGLLADWPPCRTECFDDSYFSGIAGYNRLMMSEEFYRRFESSEYILIYQLDAYVFRDELMEWCRKGYDYIGAPWLQRPVYRFPLLRLSSWIKKRYCEMTRRPNSQMTRFRVGNGGFSLRKVSSHLRAVRELQPVIRQYLSVRHHLKNEDVFFSIEVNKHGMGFSYPSWQEALEFSFDKHPALCYRWNGRRLPFGCHAWYKPRMKKFWFPRIL